MHLLEDELGLLALVHPAEGLDDVAQELHRLSTTGGWSEMPKLITDEILDLFVVRAESGAAIADSSGA